MSTIFEVRYDDDETYHVAGHFTDEAGALRFRDRLAEAYQVADKDGCHLGDSFTVVPLVADTVDPEIPFPADLFDNADRFGSDGHAWVNIDRLPLAVRS